MREVSDLQKKFLKLIEKKVLELGVLSLVFSLIFFIIFDISSDVFLPTYIVKFTKYFFEKNSIKISINFILLGIFFISLYLFVFVIEKVNNKYFFDLKKSLNRDVLKFLITERCNLQDKQEYIPRIVDDSIKIFYRIIQQIIPLSITFLLMFFFFTRGSVLYSVNIAVFTIIFYFREKKFIKKIFTRQEFSKQNNIADQYMAEHGFNYLGKNVDDFVNNFDMEKLLIDEEFHEDEIILLNNQKANIAKEKKKISLKERFIRRLTLRMVDYLFYISSFIIHFFVDHSRINFAQHIMLVYFTYKILSIMKTVLSSHSLNVKNINTIKKLLNNIGGSRIS